MPPSTFRYDSAAGTFAALDLGTRPAVDASAFVVSDLHSTAADGVQVPLTLIRKKDAVGPQITLLEAYGSYGISLLPNFGPRTLVLLQEGVNVATLSRSRRRRTRRAMAAGRQGRQQAEYVARPHRVRAGPDRARRNDERHAVHLGRIGRRHHGGHGPH